MTTLTLPRATVEQALEVLLKSHTCPLLPDDCDDAITALRAALAQQAEPDWQDLYLKEKQRADMWRDKYESVAGAEQRIYLQAEPVQEPVGEVVAIDFSEESGPEAIVTLHQDVELGTMLYTAPPQRKPLSADKTMALANETAGANWGDEAHLQRFRAAIERAHGITDPQIADRLARHGIPMPGDPK